jgi:hypothetical protein
MAVRRPTVTVRFTYFDADQTQLAAAHTVFGNDRLGEMTWLTEPFDMIVSIQWS